MILKNEQEKMEFLAECFFHINCIFKQLIQSKKSSNLALDQKYPRVVHRNILDEQKLPSLIQLKGDLPVQNMEAGKLMVLTSLYNHLANCIEKGQDLDLEIEFNHVKQKLHYTLLKKGLPSADILMKKYRYSFLKGEIIEHLLSFVWTPPSSEFLNKYEFFTQDAHSEDDFNFRYELAEHCQFDVNLISKIEPIGKGLGYVIRAKSSKEAAIMMYAIRKQLSRNKLEDSIRYIDDSEIHADEGSSTIEIWGQAMDLFANLKDKTIRKF